MVQSTQSKEVEVTKDQDTVQITQLAIAQWEAVKDPKNPKSNGGMRYSTMGLDAHGNVWKYMGDNVGWTCCNMNVADPNYVPRERD